MLPGKNKKTDSKPEQTKQAQKEGDRRKETEAYEEAEKDIEQEPELSSHNANDDLDEGETARLGDDETDLV